MFTAVRLRRSKNVHHFRLKCSKFLPFLGLRPRPRWGSYDAPSRPPSREGLLALGYRSFAPSALNRNCNRNRNRNLKTSKALLKSQAHQGTSLFTSAATNQRGVSKGGSREA